MPDTKISFTIGEKTVSIEGTGEFIGQLLVPQHPIGKVLLDAGVSPEAPENGKEERELRETGLEHAWNWFSLHAGQRMQSVNFFLIAAAFLTNAFVYALRFEIPIVASGVAFAGLVVAFLFNRLEQRVRELVKAGEHAMTPYQEQIATATQNEFIRICDHVEIPKDRVWPYSRVFGWLHFATGFGFLVGGVYALWKQLNGESAVRVEYYVSLEFIVGVALLTAGYLLTSRAYSAKDAKQEEHIKAWLLLATGIVSFLAGIVVLCMAAYLAFSLAKSPQT